jgi:hypothetical protein
MKTEAHTKLFVTDALGRDRLTTAEIYLNLLPEDAIRAAPGTVFTGSPDGVITVG